MQNSPSGPRAASLASTDALINILIVDDELRNLIVLETVLDDPSYRLVRAESADQALAALVVEEFALLILDIQMPEMNGFELAQMIKQRKRTAGVPIIFLTAYYSADQHVLEGYSTGAVDYLHKPINPTILRSKVAVFVDLHRKTRECIQANHALSSEVMERRLAQEQLHALNEQLERRVSERTADLARANAALMQTEERLRAALQAGETSVLEWEIATDHVTWLHESAAFLHEHPRRFEGTIQEFFQLIHADDRKRTQEIFESAIAHRENYSCEFRILRPDGEVRWVTNSGILQNSHDRATASMISTITDFTERQAADQKLRLQERELRSLAENTPDILTRFDAQYRYVFVNAAIEQAMERNRNDFLGKTNRDLGMPDELCTLWEEALQSVFQTKKPISLDFRFPTKLGFREYTSRLIPELGSDGQVEFVLGISQDMTEQNRAAEMLRDVDRRKDEFLATLAHELRNPLAPLRNGLMVIRLRQDLETIMTTREMMERQLSHMVRLIDDLLDVSRISSGKVTLQKSRVSLQTIAETAIETSRHYLELGRHTLTIDLPNQPVWLDADSTRLAQVLSNLLTNAAKYTPERGHISLSAQVEDEQVVIQVTDSGLGIPSGMFEKVFEMFTQVNRTLDRSQGGLGIGLALVKRLVELHGGTVEATSAGTDQGSTFVVRLPGVVQINTTSMTSTSNEITNSNSLQVLVVDDNVDGAESLSMLLKLMGHETKTAYNGPMALDVVKRFHPQVIFLDIGLPGMSGYDVARRIRQEPSLAGILLVALTGWGTDIYKHHSREAGFDIHLTKPVSDLEVEDVLAQATALSSR